MGSLMSKRYCSREVRALEEEIQEMKRERESEARAHEEKWEEWEQEKEEQMERIRSLEREVMEFRGDKGWLTMGKEYIVEQMEEKARREEAVEKWKQLYHAIKTELDDLILTTHQGERFFWGEQGGGMVEGLQRELKVKEEMVEGLRRSLAAMEMESMKKEREIDILRQSLRILSNAKRNDIIIKKSSHRGLRCRMIA
ncbi:hypothetical protein J5N97_023469 [Dioscorea zingiberensis]|uniref:Uncharacterized protein n=1 Tax=Dioscorea zingiberensis TaxID=325984 RepID=A0A9D5C5V2_9LILI|nr:hypothetical protein J5N97_023469 [Dioscorea zingiberensis]